MTFIHGNKVNKISECNLLHGIQYPSKSTKILNVHYYPIIHVYMNTQMVKDSLRTFKYYWIVDLVPPL